MFKTQVEIQTWSLYYHLTTRKNEVRSSLPTNLLDQAYRLFNRYKYVLTNLWTNINLPRYILVCIQLENFVKTLGFAPNRGKSNVIYGRPLCSWLTRTASKTILNSAGGRTSFPSAPPHGASVAAAWCGARAPPIETMRRVALFAFEVKESKSRVMRFHYIFSNKVCTTNFHSPQHFLHSN